MRRCRPLLGTFVEIAADDVAAVESGFAAIERVQRLMSFQDEASELSRINWTPVGAWTTCNRWTAEVLSRALYWAEASGGAFNPVVGEQPWTGVELRPGKVRRLGPDRLDLSGIAKGYAVDRAVAAMIGAGATVGLVNAGGDMRAFGPIRHQVQVVEPCRRRPAVQVVVGESALATSAGLPSDSGLDFAHLPGAAVRWTSVTVCAPAAMDADALTKIVLADASAALACLARVEAEALCYGPDGWDELAPAREAA